MNDLLDKLRELGRETEWEWRQHTLSITNFKTFEKSKERREENISQHFSFDIPQIVNIR